MSAEAIRRAGLQPGDAAFLAAEGEWFAAGFFEEPDAPPAARAGRAVRRQLESVPLPAYAGTPLFPCGPATLWQTRNNVLCHHYSYSFACGAQGIPALAAEAASPAARARWSRIKAALDAWPFFDGTVIQPHTLGGNGYTHSIPNYGRVLAEGLDSYGRRIAAGLRKALEDGDADREAFYAGAADTLAGIRAFHRRVRASLARRAPRDPAAKRLLAAFRRVPFAPARTFYEALVATDFIFYIDGCDSLGRLDRVLGPYYRRDLRAGRIAPDEAVAMVRLLWRNFDENSAWNVVLGGSDADGRPAYGEFTEVCLKAAVGMRRPNLALRIRPDMPDACWEAALDAIASGGGIPALYNEPLYLRGLREARLDIRHRDICEYAFGGCTETMLHGMSNVGSLDAGINILAVLQRTLERVLVSAPDFGTLLAAYKDDLARTVREVAEKVDREQETKARWRPQPVRSLLIDDCLDAGIDYNAGGARYNWSVVNVGGLANAADSLTAVRTLVYESREVSPLELRRALAGNFAQAPDLLRRIRGLPKYGNDDPAADGVAAEIARFVFNEMRRYAPWRGGRFLPGCLLFVTYAGAGAPLAASPDGRLAGEAIADSIGPHQGRDVNSPTAMLKSVAKLDQTAGIGTLVLNMRLAKSFFTSRTGRQAVRDLVATYFSLGGMQLQITVADQAVLRDAIEHPERHENLVVRVGGYSEYFNRLDPALKQTILERTEYAP